MTSTSKLAKQYQKKTDREHILDAPDTYIGSVEENDNFGWVFDPTTPTPRVTFKNSNGFLDFTSCLMKEL